MHQFTENTIKLIQEIPEGKVMYYGQIAKHAGNARGARQVVRVLHSMSKKHHLPWHRVVNAKGEISVKGEEQFHTQKLSLELEGVEVDSGGTINLDKFLYEPEEDGEWKR
ncbi:DNA methyltransferase [Sediminibacillus dalangtanensis]|uniref:DNA methyltransferase n=1 Tax=Sediminibacillus dalangtanensis TaxID=2729421 RepID=A0ABX7VPZ8_9BACI|nr:MGMT family protein [Sediminibacillus dalangtanensis]QTM98573.1 DNA methyltransferase [Sediminibacillus dalangtanensis]